MSVELPSQAVAVLGTVDPQTITTVELFTDVLDMSKFEEAMGILLTGDLASSTVDFAVYTCDSDGSNAVELHDIAQASASASANDNKQWVINVRAEQIVTASTKRYIKFGVVLSGSGGPAAVVALGFHARHKPANRHNLSSVVEIASS